MSTRTHQSNYKTDSRFFSKTARQTKRINVSFTTPRGGIRL